MIPMRCYSPRGSYFQVEGMQKASPSLPVAVIKNEEPIPPEAWEWAWKNRMLILKAARINKLTESFDWLDLWLFTLPAVGRAFARWKPDGGASINTFVFRYVRNLMQHCYTYARYYPGPKGPVVGSWSSGPQLLGNYNLGDYSNYQESEKDMEEFTKQIPDLLNVLTKKQREAIERWVGLNGHESAAYGKIAKDMRITKQRVDQLVRVGLGRIRKAMGYRPTGDVVMLGYASPVDVVNVRKNLTVKKQAYYKKENRR